MTSARVRLAALITALLLPLSGVRAGKSFDLNEVGAVLVFSAIHASAEADGVDEIETFVTLTNAKADPTRVHMSFINGNSSSNKYCYECDFDVPLSGYDTETLVLTPNGTWTDVRNDDINYVWGAEQNARFGSRTCPWNEGMLIAWPEEAPGNPDSNNRLFGDAVVVNYTQGYAYSITAHSIQSETADPTGRSFQFGNGYSTFPRVVATNFFAPTTNDAPSAELVLFTLDFKRQHPPEVDCSITGFDANENAFSSSILFGCWERIDLCHDLDPEFCYPNLGLNAGGMPHTHGWLAVNCEVDHDANDNDSTWHDGNVHGVLIQRAEAGTVLRKNSPNAPALTNAAAWARVLFQSVSKGDAGALTLESQPGSPLD